MPLRRIFLAFTGLTIVYYLLRLELVLIGNLLQSMDLFSMDEFFPVNYLQSAFFDCLLLDVANFCNL